MKTNKVSFSKSKSKGASSNGNSGNNPNWPSTTGNPSGGGRGNK